MPGFTEPRPNANCAWQGHSRASALSNRGAIQQQLVSASNQPSEAIRRHPRSIADPPPQPTWLQGTSSVRAGDPKRHAWPSSRTADRESSIGFASLTGPWPCHFKSRRCQNAPAPAHPVKTTWAYCPAWRRERRSCTGQQFPLWPRGVPSQPLGRHGSAFVSRPR